VTPSSDGFCIITISRANCSRMAGPVAEEPHHHQSDAAGDAGETVLSRPSARVSAGRMAVRRRIRLAELRGPSAW